MLIGDGIRFRYGRRGPWVLDGTSVAVAPGEVVGLAGPSGVGKSTLGRVLSGLLAPASGEVLVDGAPMAASRREVASRRGTTSRPGGPRPVQFVAQHPIQAMNPRWRIREVLSEALGAVEDVADLHGFTAELVEPAWLDRYPHELSGGQLQRVNLARSLRAEPRYLIADEITASVDAITQARLWQLLLDQVRSRGLGMLVISHDADLLAHVCGTIHAWAPPSRLELAR